MNNTTVLVEASLGNLLSSYNLLFVILLVASLCIVIVSISTLLTK